ncbi:hypothetical protein FHX28_001480 [Clostridium beijerinckii]|nr:hypothetical protein [Clostridium beijerinckii]
MDERRIKFGRVSSKNEFAGMFGRPRIRDCIWKK